jgi:Ni/Co efflux regulator RcnB
MIMNKLMLSAAALALMAAPAFAQEGDHHGEGRRGADNAAPAQAAPQQAAPQHAATQGQATPHIGGVYGHGGTIQPTRQAAPAIQAAPALQAAPQGNAMGRDRGNQQDNFRGNRNDNRNDNRAGSNNFNRTDNNFGNGSQRRDFSGVHNYHRNVTASQRFHAPSYRRPSGYYSHRWTWGDVLPRIFWAQDYWLNDFSDYDLPPPPYGAVWVRYGSDALLIDRYTGEVIEVEYGIFY